MLVSAAALPAVIAYNYLMSLYTAMRNIRLVARLDFCNSLSFAALGVGLLRPEWRGRSVVAAYGGLLSAALALVSLRRAWRAMPDPWSRPTAAFWSQAGPLPGWMLLINLLTNLFAFVDRYLIVHLAAGDALAVLGQYHSSRVRADAAGHDRRTSGDGRPAAPQPRLGGRPPRTGLATPVPLPQARRVRADGRLGRHSV